MFSTLLYVSLFLTLAVAQKSRVLIFSATKGYRHDAIPYANAALQKAGPSHKITFDVTEDPTTFSTPNLTYYDAVVFMMNTDSPEDDILNSTQQAAFKEYLNNAGNFVAIHSAAYCLHNTSWYAKELGAYFRYHPEFNKTTFLNNLEPNHPTVSMLPERWTINEEVYHFKSDPRKVGAKVVLTVDPATTAPDETSPGIHGNPHPIAWYQERGAGVDQNVTVAGRSFYTSLGHDINSWQDPTFMGHILGGITWVMQGRTTLAYNTTARVGNADGYEHPTPSSASDSSQASQTTSSQGSGSSPGARYHTAFGLVTAVTLVFTPFFL